eukprot:scaffold218651_cov30-Tisochrysis_lutea.AAC.1
MRGGAGARERVWDEGDGGRTPYGGEHFLVAWRLADAFKKFYRRAERRGHANFSCRSTTSPYPSRLTFGHKYLLTWNGFTRHTRTTNARRDNGVKR